MAAQIVNPSIAAPVSARTAKPAADRLDSWCEIAAYLRCGKRTVQRWEREGGLPVHRLRRNSLAAIYALKSELDAWWHSRIAGPRPPALPAEHEKPTIAVLPFVDLSRDKNHDYFCDGLAEEITGALSRQSGLRVASRLSAFRFKATAADTRAIGRQLRARNLLEGSVRTADNLVRVSVRLVDAEDGSHRWSATYDHYLADFIAIQQEIAAGILRGIGTALMQASR